jgi:hypothetical protein
VTQVPSVRSVLPCSPWLLVVLGAWIAGSICSSIVATQNFYTIDRLLADSPNHAFTDTVRQLGQPHARDFLRYLSSELNRLYFRLWNVAQIPIALFALWAFADRRAPSLRAAYRVVIAMFVVVVLMNVWLTPAIVSLGRELDFVPREPPPPGMSRFWVLHAAYTSLEMLKLAAGFLVAYWIVKLQKGQARQAGQERLEETREV